VHGGQQRKAHASAWLEKVHRRRRLRQETHPSPSQGCAGTSATPAHHLTASQAFKSKPAVKDIKKAIQKDFPDHKFDDGCYPDMRDGRFAQHLSDGEWYEFNNHQRAHHNSMESLPLALTLVLTAGLFQPEVAAAMGLLFTIGRCMAGTGYRTKGPKGRFTGGIIALLSFLPLIGVNGYYGVKHGLASAGVTLF